MTFYFWWMPSGQLKVKNNNNLVLIVQLVPFVRHIIMHYFSQLISACFAGEVALLVFFCEVLLMPYVCCVLLITQVAMKLTLCF